MSFISAPCFICAAFVCTEVSVALSFGRFSARPEANLSHVSFAPASCSRASRINGCRPTTSVSIVSAVGISPEQAECALHGLDLRAHRCADRDVVEHFAPQPIGHLRAAFGDATDLQVDARCELLDAEAGFDAVFGHRFQQRTDGPPERPEARLRGRVLDAGDRVAHRLRAFLVAAKPGEQAALVVPPLLDQKGRQPVLRNRFARRDARRLGGQIRIEELGRCHGAHAARALHRLVFGIELERDRHRAVHQLVEEDLELAACAVDDCHAFRHRLLRQVLEPRQVPLDFIGERDDRVEADHLDRAGRLVDVRARMLERRHVLRLRRERGERLQPSRERLVDLRLDPGQRPQIEVECRFGSHGRSFLTHGSRPSCKCATDSKVRTPR